MIRKKEIEQKAEAQNVPKSTIDKDWVLGHFLDAIYSVPECREKLIFKGGTCLRKCCFPNYRFSEDLDFTSIDPTFVLDKKLLTQITDFVTSRTEIPLYIQEISELRFNDQLTGYKAIVKFWGADHSSNQAPPSTDRWSTSVKIEIILYEHMVFSFENREVFHPYTDGLSETPLFVPCYSLREVLAEKLRALIQRSYTAPRDFYDIWYLANDQTSIDWNEIKSAFHEKMKFKNLEFEGTHQMLNETNDKRVKAAWQNSLGHQIPGGANPTYEEVKEFLVTLLGKIFSEFKDVFNLSKPIQFNPENLKQVRILRNQGEVLQIKKINLLPLFQWNHPKEWGKKLVEEQINLHIECISQTGAKYKKSYDLNTYVSLVSKDPIINMEKRINVPESIADKEIGEDEFPMEIRFGIKSNKAKSEFEVEIILAPNRDI